MITSQTQSAIRRFSKLWTKIIMCALPILFLPRLLSGHDGVVVHPCLTEKSLEIEGHGFYAAYKTAIKDGSRDEDHQDLDNHKFPENPLDYASSPFKHFYDPKTQKGLPGSMTAKQSAIEHWNWAISASSISPSNTDYNGPFHLLGQVCHLLEDMSSPAHVHNDAHGTGDDFEKWGKDYLPFFAFPRGLSSYIPPSRNIEGFMDMLASFTYNLSTFQGDLSTDPPPDSELKRMFPSLHFDSLLGVGRWDIDNIGTYEGFASKEDDWWECEGNSGHFYIENTEDAVPTKFEKPLKHLTPEQAQGMSLHEVYSRELYPETVRYCAGLLLLYYQTVSPSVESRPATPISQTEATLNAEITKRGTSNPTKYMFQWLRADQSGPLTPLQSGIIVSGDMFSYKLTGLTPNTQYKFCAFAQNAAGWGPPSETLNFTTNQVPNLPAPALTFPANAAPNLSLTPTFTWSQVTGNIGYRIMVSSDSSKLDPELPSFPSRVTFTGEINATVSAGTTSYQVPTNKLLAATPYYWMVNALGSTSYGTWSEVRRFTTASGSTPQVVMPFAIPSAGSYTTAQNVFLATVTPGAEIRYTVNGTEPSQSSTLDGTGINIAATTTLKAKAFKSGMTPSQTWTGVYNIASATTLQPPTFNPDGGSCSGSVRVTLTGPSGATIRYTTDNNNPTATRGFIYSSPFLLSSTTTVKALSCASGWNPSGVVSATYTITAEQKCSPPYFTPSPSDYPSAQTVEILCDTPGAVIRYRTGSSDPTPTMGAIYNSPVAVASDSTTIRAIAYIDGEFNSESSVVRATYTITPPPPDATLACSPPVINRTISIGENNPSDTCRLWSTTGGDVKFTVSSDSNWLSTGRFAGTATSQQMEINPYYHMSLLAPGEYHGKITIRDTNTSNKYTVEIPVNLTVLAFPASIEVSKNSLSAVVTERQNASNDSFTIRNAGGGTLSYGLGTDTNWLLVSPTNGENSGETDSIDVQYATSALTAGTHTANIVITASQGLTKTLPVSLTVNPFGANLPIISSISPRIGSVEGDIRVTIKGENLQDATTVTLDGVPATNLLAISSTELRMTTPPREKIGRVDVVVVTDSGSATSRKGYEYTYLRGNNIEEVAQLGGSTVALTVEGNYAYIQQGSTLVILNVQNPASPTFVGKVRLPGLVKGIAVSGDRAYVANGDMGLVVLDISDRTNPNICGYHGTPGYADGIKLLGGYAYVIDSSQSILRMYNIIDPSTPQFVSSVQLGSYPWDLCLAVRSGKVFCYIACNGGMDIVEVTNPTSPTIRGQYTTSGVAYGIAVKEDYAYLGQDNPDSSFHVINITDPQNLSSIGMVPGGWWCLNGLVISNDNRVYLSGLGKVMCFDVSNPSDPIEVQGGDLGGSDIIGGQTVLRGNTIFAATGSYGMASVSIGNPDSPTKVGSFNPLLGHTADVHVLNGYVYAAYNNDGFRVIDVHSPENPVIRGEYNGIRILGMADYNGYLYATCDGGAGIKSFDVSDPNVITVKASSDPNLEYFGIGLTVKDGILYSGGIFSNTSPWTNGLNVFDITNPSSIVYKNGCASPSNFYSLEIAVSGSLACLSDANGGGMQFFDISVSPPGVRGYFDTTGGGQSDGVALSGTTAYLADGKNSLRLIDASNPDAPTNVSTFDTSQSARKVILDGRGLAYVTDGDIYSVDVTDPSHPSLWGSYRTPGYCERLTVNGDYIYVADGRNGLEILRKKDVQKPSVLIMNPPAEDSYTTVENSISLAGAADDNRGIAVVSWTNDRGGSGAATGTNSWTANNIPLQPGKNVITVTAEDETGNTEFDTLTVISNPPDSVPPHIISILNQDSTPSSSTVVHWTVCFDEPVTGGDVADFLLTKTGTLAGEEVTSVSGTGATRTVMVNTGTGDGTIRLDLQSADTGIADLAGNLITGGFTAGQSYTIDHTEPSVVSILRSSSSPTNASTIAFDVRFSEDVQGLDLSDFDLAADGVTGAELTGIAGGGGTYIVSMTTGGGDGTIKLELRNSGTGIKDGAGNTVSTGFRTGESYVIDRTAPIITLYGVSPVEVELGTTFYVDSGATASDAVDGLLSADIMTTGLPVNIAVPGTRFVIYTVTDSAGNTGQAIRVIQVNPAVTYTLTISPPTNGTVTAAPDQTTFNAGETVVLTAAPAVGYKFTGWTGDATGTENPLTVTMDADKSIGANFLKKASKPAIWLISNLDKAGKGVRKEF